MTNPLLRAVALVAALATVPLIACMPGASEDSESQEASATARTRWQLPATVKTAGARVRVTYDRPPSWTGRCPYASLRVGTKDLGDALKERYSAVKSVGGYACRPNTANRRETSVHGTGRALDVFVPTKSGQADPSKGDPIANWLVTNASEIGIQLIIWNRTIWRANGTNERAYGGPHPHHDHIHVEITEEAAAKQLAWYSGRSSLTAEGDAGAADAGPTEEVDTNPAPTEDDEDDSDYEEEEDTTPPPVDPKTPPPVDPPSPPAKDPLPATPPETEGPMAPPAAPVTPTQSTTLRELPEGDDGEFDDAPAKSTKKPKETASADEAASTGCSVAYGSRLGGGNMLALVGVAAVVAGLRRKRSAGLADRR